MKGIIKLLLLSLIFALGVVCIIGSSGGGGDDGDGGGNDIDGSNSSIVGNWSCTTKYTDTFGDRHTNYSDQNYYSGGSCYFKPDGSPCNYYGTWESNENSFTTQITSVSGTEDYCTTDHTDMNPQKMTITELRQDMFSYIQSIEGIQYNTTCY
jgi:hypothetical protein